MKKKILSPEALARIMGSGEEEVKVSAEDASVEVKPDEVKVDTVDANKGGEASGEGEDVKAEEVGAEGKEEEEEVDAVALEDHKAALEAQEKELTEKHDSLMQAKEEAMSATMEDLASMQEVVVGQIKTMRTALSLADVDMSDWKAGDVLAEHAKISDTYMSSLPVGSVIDEPKGEVEKQTVTREVQSSLRSLGF